MFEDPNVNAIIAGTMVTKGWVEFKDNSFFTAASRRHPEKPIVTFATSERVIPLADIRLIWMQVLRTILHLPILL